MPYYPGGGIGDEVHYRLNTKGEKLVIDYLNITIFDVQEMPIDLYLYFMREANIHKLMQTKEGREYLDNCWRMEQTKPDRKKLREKMRKGER
ncbi:hypothetical protein DW266_13420 [Blautia sp. AM22-22LB]|nr:hypothetical protein DW266_13420 [Blautia sp. AM22-22LB]